MSATLKDMGIEIHQMADLFPMLKGEDWKALVEDIKSNGIQIPVVWSADGQVLVDGRNRLTAWVELGNDVAVAPSTKLAAGVDELAYIVSANLKRRQLSKDELALLAEQALPVYEAAARKRMLAGVADPEGNFTQGERAPQARDIAGKDFGVDGSYISKASKLRLQAPDLYKQVQSGGLKLYKAYDKLKESYTPAKAVTVENTTQPVRDLPEISLDDLFKWAKVIDLDTLEDTVKNLILVLDARHKSVCPSPFTKDEKSSQADSKAEEKADRLAAQQA